MKIKKTYQCLYLQYLFVCLDTVVKINFNITAPQVVDIRLFKMRRR